MNIFSNAFNTTGEEPIFLNIEQLAKMEQKVSGIDVFFESKKKLNLASFAVAVKYHVARIFLGVDVVDLKKHGKFISKLKVSTTIIRGAKNKYKFTCMFPSDIVKMGYEVTELIQQTRAKFGHDSGFMGCEFYLEIKLYQ